MKLPLDCTVEYVQEFLTKNEANTLYDVLINEYKIHEEQLILKINGETFVTDSFKILFATKKLIDLNSHPESVHGKAFEWSGFMAKLKKRVEDFTKKNFDLAMCLYSLMEIILHLTILINKLLDTKQFYHLLV